MPRLTLLSAFAVSTGWAILDPVCPTPLLAQETSAVVADHAPPTPAAYLGLAAEMEANLERHVIEKWYPSAIDSAGRGFVQNFDASWQATDDGVRSIVYQSRLTWLAAHTAMRRPEHRDAFDSHARHGLAFLRDVMWDKDEGGFFWAVGPEDRPLAAGDKHVYGIAFAIYAASAVHRSTGDPDALGLAQKTFRWLEDHAHDATNGGYFEALTREGQPIREPSSASDAATSDAIGTRLGFKSMNTHIHLLEAFTALYAQWPDPLVHERLEEVFSVVRDKVVVGEVGCQNLYFTPAWRPIPAEASFGHDVETAFLLVEAAGALGRHHDAETWAVARRLVDHALAFGWDAEHGGFFDHGPAFGPVVAREKVWWVQAEGLNALTLMHARFGRQTPKYWEALNRQWDFIVRHQVDAEHGGWRSRVGEAGEVDATLAKSDAWREGYHQGRALMTSAATLRALADPAEEASHR